MVRNHLPTSPRLVWVMIAALLVTPAAAQPVAAPGVPTLAPVIERVAPAVVNIAVMSRAAPERNPLFQDPFFRRFFDLPDQPPVRPQASAGSGILIPVVPGHRDG